MKIKQLKNITIRALEGCYNPSFVLESQDFKNIEQFEKDVISGLDPAVIFAIIRDREQLRWMAEDVIRLFTDGSSISLRDAETKIRASVHKSDELEKKY